MTSKIMALNVYDIHKLSIKIINKLLKTNLINIFKKIRPRLSCIYNSENI